MNISSRSHSSSSTRQLYCADDSPHMETRDRRIDDGDMFLEKCIIKHDPLVRAKAAIARGYTYDSLSPCPTNTPRPENSCSEGEEEDDELTSLVLRQLSTTYQHQQRKRETQKPLESEQVQSNILAENIGTASCLDSFLRACDAIARAIIEEIETNDDENDKCTSCNDIGRRNNTIGRKVVRFDLSRNTIFLF